MKLTHLIWREIAHRKLNFGLTLAAVVVAVACSVGMCSLLRAHQLAAQAQVQTLAAETEASVRQMDDQIRKITKGLGFNILILPKDQNLADFHADDFAAQTMPEQYVHRLAKNPGVLSINHLRPALVRKLEWPEQKRQIVLMGVRGVVPLAHRRAKQPLAQPVPPGKIDVGHVLAQQLQLEPGDAVTLLSETLEVNRVKPAAGNKDDITVWIDLDKAQHMLNLDGQINMIQALECNCASIDRLAQIEKEISSVLGGEVQVIELATQAIARAEARNRVNAEGLARLENIKQHNRRTLRRLEQLGAILIPLLILAAGVWVGLLSLANVRQRRSEIGVLRALGMRSNQILRVFLTKAAIVGFLGAAIGSLTGFAAAISIDYKWQGASLAAREAGLLFMPTLLVVVLLVTPLLTVLAGWLPALLAASQDPAHVLHDE